MAFVDLVGRRRRAVAVGAVLFAGLAAGRLRLELGRTLAERSGLTLPRAECLAELPGQVGDQGFEFGHTLGKFPTTGACRLVHDRMLTTRNGFSCASLEGR